MTALRIENVGISFGATEVLRKVSLHVEPGEFVSILGPSGAGKSTLFGLLTQAVTPDHGTIHIDGTPLARQSRTFAYMPQRDALLPWLRVLDNVTLGLEVQGVPRAAARAKALPLFGDFGLAGFERHYPAQLSGGMRQRAALLRTVIQDRPIQLLDEPFGALDALTRMQMQRWLEARWLAAKWTTLLITHDVREAVALSDRIYVLSDRPAHVIDEVAITTPRPRLDRPLPDSARALEDRLLKTLLTKTGD
jgi:ABC-type nitrate/sulfonate/bicarbonate transport system ATPase subunit